MRRKTEHTLSPELVALNNDMHEGVQLIPWKRWDAVFKKLQAPLNIGSRVWWYYRDERKFWREEGLKDYRSNAGYSGLLIPQPGCERRSITGEMEIEDVIVVHDWYPTEKCYPDCQYVTLIRLLLSPGLVEIFSKEQDVIGINSH